MPNVTTDERRVQLNMRFKQMDSIWTFVAISREFLHLNTRIHYESQTKTICRVNETPHETWRRRFWDEAFFNLALHLSYLAEPDD